ncbi:MAG: hypothetical protein JO205_01505 [Pseudolabrys sp.]|nr:hypothetical protein [Pseudolabrys sp.]MBV9260025.1 hypothetical protein [Pseudolabrys sp.]
MTEHLTLRVIGTLFGAVTGLVMLIGAVVVNKHLTAPAPELSLGSGTTLSARSR